MTVQYGTVLGQATTPPPLGRVDRPLAKPKQQMQQPPEASLPRSLNYYADYSGCGHWRMIWPEQLLNAYQKHIVQGTSVMIFDNRYYHGIETVRIQRQATPSQLDFLKWLRDMCDKTNINLVYEIDDICFREDIPDYNKFKFAFDKEEIRTAVIDMMELTDEMTVTCQFMKDYYMSKTNHKKVTVIPNYMPKFWIGNHYNRKSIERNFRQNVNKPRILYAGSGAHFDVSNKAGQQDDFAHVLEVITKTVDDYQWVFMGAFPQLLRPLIQAGKIEFHPWTPLYEYPSKIQSLNINCMVAPLQDNNFNRAKSNLKFIEACAFGVPIVCQDMCTYEDAFFKFNTGDELTDNIKEILRGTSTYMRHSDQSRAVAEGLWMEDHVDVYNELYKYNYGSKERVKINKLNNIVAN